MGIRSRDQGAFASQGGVEVPAGSYPQEGVKGERLLESEKSCLIHPPAGWCGPLCPSSATLKEGRLWTQEKCKGCPGTGIPTVREEAG